MLKKTTLLCASMLIALPAAGQRTLPAERDLRGLSILTQGSTAAACESGAWATLAQIDEFEVEDLAVGPAGEIFLAGNTLASDLDTRLSTLRSLDGGATWEWVDRVPAPGEPESAGAHAVHVGADGTVYVLGWRRIGGIPRPVIRRSLAGGDPQTWETVEGSWEGTSLGAIGSDESGQVYLALGFAERGANGWRVYSSYRGEGPWILEDLYSIEDPSSYDVHPHDLAVSPPGQIVVAGQINGDPDRWVVRRGEAGDGPWKTLDLFEYTGHSYGLAAASVALRDDDLRDPGLLVVGYGVPGGGDDAYRWLVRRSRELMFRPATLDRRSAGEGGGADDAWTTEEFQLEPGLASFGLDAEVDSRGNVVVAGVGSGPQGLTLVVRRTEGAGWRTLLEFPGITSVWDVRLAIGADDRTYAAGIVGPTTVLLGCNP